MKDVDGDPKAMKMAGVPLRDILCGLSIFCKENIEGMQHEECVIVLSLII